MLILSYNLSETLTSQLKQIDKLRERLLLAPLSPYMESSISWLTTLSHLEGWASLSNQPLTKDTLESLLKGPGANRTVPSNFVQKALNYRSALSHVWQEWTANPKAIKSEDIRTLARILDVTFVHENEIESLLGYIQTGSVHPAVQAAITHLYFYPNRLCYLTSQLVLNKYGYDFKRLVSLEDYWAQNKDRYLEVLKQASTQGNITLWLEYYCQAMINQLEKTYKLISQPVPSNHILLSLSVLNSRQKTILSLIDQPGSSITNRQIQANLQISQITASRDLARLTKLNLVIPQGRGRSVSYSKL